MSHKRVALIENGQVANVVVVLDGQAIPEGGVVLDANSPVGPGWSYDGDGFAPSADPVQPAGVPAEVWTYQAKTVMALTTLESLGLSGEALGLPASASLYDAVLAGIAALPEQQRLVATIQLEGAPGTRRDAPLLASLAGPLGLTDAMIDQLFIAAAAIP